LSDRIGGQLAREAPARIRAEAKRRREVRAAEPSITVELTAVEARALLRFDLDPPAEWLRAEQKIRKALEGEAEEIEDSAA
jgi:hypothetical protein